MCDDGGLSAGTIERSALQLHSDIKAAKVQIIVVYKVDRLTRCRRLREGGTGNQNPCFTNRKPANAPISARTF